MKKKAKTKQKNPTRNKRENKEEKQYSLQAVSLLLLVDNVSR